jgi:hypothetical protein
MIKNLNFRYCLNNFALSLLRGVLASGYFFRLVHHSSLVRRMVQKFGAVAEPGPHT